MSSTAADQEPQRKALTDLIARFTADRDRMIATVQDCEARLEDVVARLRNHAPQPQSDGAEPSADLADVRAAMHELQQEIESLRVRGAGPAVDTAVRALAAESTETRAWLGDLRAQFPRLRTDVERTATQLREAIEEVRAAVSRIEAETTAAAGAPEPSAPIDPARVDAQLAELWQRVERLVEPLGAQLHGVEARSGSVEAELRERLAADGDRLATLAAAVERLDRSVATRPTLAAVPPPVVVDGALERAVDDQRRRQEESTADVARLRSSLAVLATRVAEMETAVAAPPRPVLPALLDEVRDLLRERVGAFADGVWREWRAWFPRLSEAFRFAGGTTRD